jgi:hypothetical protein
VLPRRILNALGRGFRAVGRTVASPDFLVNTALVGGVAAIAVAIGMLTIPGGIAFAGASCVAAAFLYTRGAPSES